MDSKTSLVILGRVKAAKEKQATEAPPPAAPSPEAQWAEMGDMVRQNPGAGVGSVLGAGLSGAAKGIVPGALLGLGYGVAKGRPVAGTARGAGRAALTLGGAGLGGAGGFMGGVAAGASPLASLGLGLGGAVLGGVGGWKGADRLMGKDMEEKTGLDGLDPSAAAFSDALQGMAATQLKSDAFRDVRNVGLTALGVGAAGRGLVGLLQHMRSNKPRKTRSGPAYLPLPFPASPEKTGSLKAVLPLLQGAGRKVGGILGQGVRDAKLGLGVGQESRDLANLTAKARGGYQSLAQGVDDAANIRPALDPLGRADARMATNATEELQFLNHNHTPNRVNSLYSALDALNRSKARGDRMVNVGAGVGGAVAGNQLTKRGGFLDGGEATSKSGIPWYGPAMLLGGLGGLGLGWKGMDSVLDARRKKQMEGELVTARQQFHDALLGQYDKPVELHPELMKKSADEATMEKVGRELDALYDKFVGAVTAEEARPTEKAALDLSNMAGQAAGGYGMYAALSGLLTGSLVYDKMAKRSRRSVLESALKKRQRRRFMQQPTEIYAQPEPVPVPAG
jgi:hypothetical protein